MDACCTATIELPASLSLKPDVTNHWNRAGFPLFLKVEEVETYWKVRDFRGWSGKIIEENISNASGHCCVILKIIYFNNLVISNVLQYNETIQSFNKKLGWKSWSRGRGAGKIYLSPTFCWFPVCGIFSKLSGKSGKFKMVIEWETCRARQAAAITEGLRRTPPLPLLFNDLARQLYVTSGVDTCRRTSVLLMLAV